MPDDYIPKVNDYVIWDRGRLDTDEGWVYFVDKEYITIEVGVRPTPKHSCTNGKRRLHDNIHTLLLCFPDQWKELKYIKSRESKYE